MKMIDIVETLVSEGHKVKYRHRTDGGLIITSIDGKKFTSLTEGNRTARSMVVGGELSFARAEQVAYNVKKYIKLNTKENQQTKKATGKIEDRLNTQLKKVQRLWQKNEVQAGKISKKRLRFYIRSRGREGAMEYLEGRERYAKGIANNENIDILMERIKRMANNKRYSKHARILEALYSDMENLQYANEFKEEWIPNIYGILGTSEGKNITSDMIPSIVRQIRDIIGKPDEVNLSEIGIK